MNDYRFTKDQNDIHASPFDTKTAVQKLLRAKRLATVFAWLCPFFVILLIVITAILVEVVNASDTVGGLCSIFCILGLIISTACAIAYRISAAVQRKRLDRKFKDRKEITDALMAQSLSPEKLFKQYRRRKSIATVLLLCTASIPMFFCIAVAVLFALAPDLELNIDLYGPYFVLTAILLLLFLLPAGLGYRYSSKHIYNILTKEFPKQTMYFEGAFYPEPDFEKAINAYQTKRNLFAVAGAFAVFIPFFILFLFTVTQASYYNIALFIIIFVYLPVLLEYALIVCAYLLIQKAKIRYQFPQQLHEYRNTEKKHFKTNNPTKGS